MLDDAQVTLTSVEFVVTNRRHDAAYMALARARSGSGGQPHGSSVALGADPALSAQEAGSAFAICF